MFLYYKTNQIKFHEVIALQTFGFAQTHVGPWFPGGYI